MSNLKVSSTLNNAQSQKINFSGENNGVTIRIRSKETDKFISETPSSKKNVREQINEALQTYNDAVRNARKVFSETVKKAREELAQKMQDLVKKEEPVTEEPQNLLELEEMRRRERRRQDSGSGLCMYSIPEVY